MIINLTQHASTDDQRAAGVVDLPESQRAILAPLLTFDDVPTHQEIVARANHIAELAIHNDLGGEDEDPIPLQAMIGGAPYLMAPLEAELRDRGVVPCYAFSKRESVEDIAADGSVIKKNIFRHAGFVIPE